MFGALRRIINRERNMDRFETIQARLGRILPVEITKALSEIS